MGLTDDARLSADHVGDGAVVQQVLGALGADPAHSATVIGRDPVTRSPHRIGDAASAALAALGIEAADLWAERTGQEQTVTVRMDAAVHQLIGVLLATSAGKPVFELMEPGLVAVSGFYRARDGRSVYLPAAYPHLRDIVCDVLRCAPSAEQLTEAIARRDALDLEEEIAARKGVLTAVRTAEEWRDHPHGRWIAAQPLVEIERIGESSPEPLPELPPGPGLPLSGTRVLDNTAVIAGPTSARHMAELGADVLHLSHRQELDTFHREGNIGKHCAYCDLGDPDDAARFRKALREADVFVSGMRNLDTKGAGADELAAERPGLVVLEISAFGHGGPWRGRGGFDPNVCGVIGLSAAEGSFETPRLSPTMLLNDYLTPALGAAGVIEALRRRARDGGSYRVRLSLAGVATWVQSLGTVDPDLDPDAPLAVLDVGSGPLALAEMRRRLDPKLVAVPGPYGVSRYLPLQIEFSAIRPRLRRGLEPIGAAELAWS